MAAVSEEQEAVFQLRRICAAACIFLGPRPVQVWPHKDLFPGRPGGVSGEAASGPAEESLRDYPETLPGVEPEKEVPAHEGGSRHSAGVHPWKEDNPVRAVHFQMCCLCLIAPVCDKM